MARERKRNHAPATTPGVLAPPDETGGASCFEMGPSDAVPGSSVRSPFGEARPVPPLATRHIGPDGAATERTRWFLPVDRTLRPQLPTRRRGYVITALLVVALLGISIARGVLMRVLLPIVLAAAAVTLLLRRSARRVRARAAKAETERVVRRGLELDGQRLALHVAPSDAGSAAPYMLLSAVSPFGVTLLATRRRDRVVAALSSATGTFYVAAAFDDDERRRFAALLARASIVSSDEAGLEAIGPDGEPIELGAAEFTALVDALTALDTSCTDRFLLSDARGAPVTLEGQELRIKDHRFDLTASLDWRAIVFQEAFGQAVAIYQGTWIRQGGAEVVLVSLLPSIAPLGPMTEADSTGLVELDRATLRDLRLMQATPEEPPPQEQRVAIDRLFMLPLRTALDRAPRPSTQPARARA